MNQCKGDVCVGIDFFLWNWICGGIYSLHHKEDKESSHMKAVKRKIMHPFAIPKNLDYHPLNQKKNYNPVFLF